jgi:hypothetical protein
MYFYDLAFRVIALLAVQLQINDVPGGDERYENHHVTDPGQGFALGGDIRDGHRFQYRQNFSFFCQNATV